MASSAITPPKDAAAVLLARALWGAHPCRVDGVDALAIAAPDRSFVLALDGEARAFLSRAVATTARVVVFEDAKAAQRWLLDRDIDVARPICRRTLDALSRGESTLSLPEPASLTTGADHAARIAADAVHGLEHAIERLEHSGQKKVGRLECLVTRAFAALERRGLPVDVGLWRALIDEEKSKLRVARESVLALAGDHVPRDLFGVADINLEADAEVRALLRRATGVTLDSVGRSALERLAHPLGAALIAYKEAWKLVSTYGDAFLEHARDVAVDGAGRRMGRVRSTFVPLGASTGRVACREPNLQNLPKEARFHDALRAAAGHVLVTADYGTCELRIVAELAGDPVFIAAFDRGEDLHSTVATSMFGVQVSKTENSELRQRAKAINFGLVYGMGAAALAESLGVDRGAADELLARYFKTFPRIRDYLEGSVETALRRGYSETVLGRRLRHDQAVLDGEAARGELSRIMKNMPIQGTSADMTKLAMVRIHERLARRPNTGLVNTIHDELVVECPASSGAAVAAIVATEMAEAHRTLLRRVPPAVEVHVGPTWHH